MAGSSGCGSSGGHDAHAAVNRDLTFLLIYWACTLLSLVVAEFTRLSPLLFYLIFGIVLRNAQVVNPDDSPFLKTFSELAIAVVFFALGFEEKVKHFMEGIKKAWGIAFIGALVPFIIGFCLTLIFWPGTDMKVALMGGLAVTATAVSLTMIALKAEGLATSKPAIGIMTSAVLDDIASLALVSICVPIATGEAQPTVVGIVTILGKAAGFFAVIIFLHCVVLPNRVETGLLSKIPLVRTYGAETCLRFNQGEQAVLMSLMFGLFCGMVAVWLEFHPAIGAYMGGLICEECYYELEDSGNTYQNTLHLIENAAYTWLGPIFFVNLGASIDLSNTEAVIGGIGYAFIFYICLAVGQFLSASISARYVPGGFTWAESFMIGFGMLGRAELFFVVLQICKEKKIMNDEIFLTFTMTAVLLDITVPICITLYKPHYMKMRLQTETGKIAWGNGKEEVPQAIKPELSDWVSDYAHKRTVARLHRVIHVTQGDQTGIDVGNLHGLDMERARIRVGSKHSVCSISSNDWCREISTQSLPLGMGAVSEHKEIIEVIRRSRRSQSHDVAPTSHLRPNSPEIRCSSKPEGRTSLTSIPDLEDEDDLGLPTSLSDAKV